MFIPESTEAKKIVKTPKSIDTTVYFEALWSLEQMKRLLLRDDELKMRLTDDCYIRLSLCQSPLR